MIRVALIGNPNCGKTTLFNNLTGLHQHVGNWPGKTVEKKEGICGHGTERLSIIDLPGTYSLTAYSTEEIITRDYLVEERPDVVVHVVDAANLERNLYLTVQTIELGANIIIALNMNRYAQKKGLKIDEKGLAELLGVPVCRIEAVDRTGREKLLDAIIDAGRTRKNHHNKVRYNEEIEDHLIQLEQEVSRCREPQVGGNARWIALKLLEEDRQVIEKVSTWKKGKEILRRKKAIQQHLQEVFGEDVDAAIADARYGVIAGLIKETVRRPKIDRITRTDYIDRVVTNRYVGIPLFLIIMYLMFQATFTLAVPFTDLISRFFSMLGTLASQGILLVDGPRWLGSLLVDGIIGGVGSVLIFLPNILLLFFIIALLEDSGYMARAAFIMDKLMQRIGLHGKSFIPLILGFGCNVPAIMATRTLKNRKDRILTILINPLMSCSARLMVYVLFVGAFFEKDQGIIIFSLYLLGILMAIAIGLLFKRTLFRGETSPFIMELPPYRLPTLKGMLIHMWERSRLFITKAGTIIFSAVLVIWFLGNIPFGVPYASEQSIIGIIGRFIAPLFAPLGFGTWQASVSLLFGILAKEVVVGTMGTLYGVAEAGLGTVLKTTFTPLTAYVFMVFTLLYIPCVATLSAIRRETNSWRWMWFSVFYLTALAWTVSFIIYQGGLLLGLG
ncbi:MAG: ferrous iron transport protein B [DPANN group archaeon]|nr:ferrous iron transport protein B [DPANN group archaeon]